MRLQLMPIMAKVTNVKTNSGDKNGRHWESTSFCIVQQGKAKDGSTFESKKLFRAWSDLGLKDGHYYLFTGCYTDDEKDKDGKYTTAFYVQNAEPVCLAVTDDEQYEEPSYEGMIDAEDESIPF